MKRFNMMLFSANKWLLAHSDAPEAIQGSISN